jgi:hypothetical protein
MGKSFRNQAFYDDYDYEYEDGGRQTYKKSKGKKNDKKLLIQQERKKAQAERDKMAAEFAMDF